MTELAIILCVLGWIALRIGYEERRRRRILRARHAARSRTQATAKR